MDMSSLMETFMGMSSEEVEHELDEIYVKPAMYNIIESMNSLEAEENDLVRRFPPHEEKISKQKNEKKHGTA